jgi:hypothetical protein
LLAQVGARGVQRRCDGPWGDPEGRSDPLVVEIGVVAQEQHEPLPFREHRDRLAHSIGARIAVAGGHVRVVEPGRNLGHWGPTPARLVDDDLPDPWLELAPYAPPVTHRPHEALVDGVAGELLLAGDRERDPQEAGKGGAVHGLDLVERGHSPQ